jgi:hypothetical protein
MTYGRDHVARIPVYRHAAAVSHSAELVRGDFVAP